MTSKRRHRRPAVRKFQPQDNEILNAEEAAEVLGISKRLLLRLARSGQVPGKKLGREWRFLRSAIRQSLGQVEAGQDLLSTLDRLGVKYTLGRPPRRK